jgi:hypothetical protein
MSTYVASRQIGLYPRSIQAEEISVLGWLLYSTRDINVESLSAAIMEGVV